MIMINLTSCSTRYKQRYRKKMLPYNGRKVNPSKIKVYLCTKCFLQDTNCVRDEKLRFVTPQNTNCVSKI